MFQIQSVISRSFSRSQSIQTGFNKDMLSPVPEGEPRGEHPQGGEGEPTTERPKEDQSSHSQFVSVWLPNDVMLFVVISLSIL